MIYIFLIPLYFLISFFWFFRQIKTTLFWLYLWQLKEYHIGRFLDHFRTEKGKRILINKLVFFKIFLLFLFLFFVFFFQRNYEFKKAWGFTLDFIFSCILFFLYFFESIKAFTDFFRKTLKKPIFTKKIIFLFSLISIFTILFLFLILIPKIYFLPLIGLLLFDILIPFFVSAILLIFQPLAVLWRWQIIKKAIKKREKFKELLVIGITGSYGKTSTKEFLTEILSEKFKVLKTLEHQNSEVAISKCILNDLKKDHQIFVVEMGAYNRGGIKLLCDISKPKIGILTGINEQHMATFGSLENIIKTKYELIESLPENGLAIFNGNNEYCLKLYQKTKILKKICQIENHEADFSVKNLKIEKEFISFTVLSKDGDWADFKLNLIGAQNLENILLAACCAKELGMSLKEISNACQKIKQSGIKLIKRKDGLNIIDSTYSANPDGVIAHLDYLKIWPGKKVIVMPCLIELGKASIEVHKKIGEKIGKVCDLAIITTKERFKEIKEGAIKSGMKKENILFLENSKEIFERIKTFCQPEDVVLLEGRIPKELIELLVK